MESSRDMTWSPREERWGLCGDEEGPGAIDQLGLFFPPLTNDSAFSSVLCHVCPSPLKLSCLLSCVS